MMSLQAQNLWPLGPEKFADVFRYQYVISRARQDISGFRNFEGAGWHLAAGAELPVCDLVDRDGHPLGYLIGVAVGPEGLLKDGANRIPAAQDDAGFWDVFETWLTELAGRYALLLTVQGQTRFYVDPVGMIGAVYNAADGLVAASTLMAITDEVQPNPKFDFDIIRDHGGKLSLFHTADVRVRRLNPNYYLDLGDFSIRRHWPRDEQFALQEHQVLGAYDEIARRAAFNIGEITRAYPVSLPITGGQDSRLILAFSRGNVGRFTRIYTHINNPAGRRDAAIGAALCARIGLPHEVHHWRDARIKKWLAEEFQISWNLAHGVESVMPREYQNGAILHLPEKEIILRGHQTDILRAVYVFKHKQHWSRADWQIKRLLIVPNIMFDDDVAARFSDDFFAWQGTLPANAMEKAADFMFLEVFYNSTIGASFAASWRNFYISPFNSRKLIALALSFPETVRRASEPVFDLIERLSPDLSPVRYDFDVDLKMSSFGEPAQCDAFTADRIAATKARLATLKAG